MFILLLFISFGAFANDLERVFTRTYEVFPWTEEGFSINGSSIEITRDYVEYVQDFMKKNQVKSVVDIGCGDWAFSRYIDWSGIEYLGIDVVKMVIDRNQKLFATPSIVFIQGDARFMDLPEADLMVCKDVFQHLSNEDIFLILKQIGKFKHCLITNFIDPETLGGDNRNIATGGLHNIDLSKPPFNLVGEKVLTFFPFLPKQTFYVRNLIPSPH